MDSSLKYTLKTGRISDGRHTVHIKLYITVTPDILITGYTYGNITSRVNFIITKGKKRRTSKQISNNDLKIGRNHLETHNPISKALHQIAEHATTSSAYKGLHNHSLGITTNNR
jgi:hypothetical protein